MPAGSFVLCEDYQDASQLAFILTVNQKPISSVPTGLSQSTADEKTQFDMWPDRELNRPELIGKDVIYLGTMSYEPLRESFDSVEKLPVVVVNRNGFDIRQYALWRCRGFHGISRPAGQGTF